MKIRLPLFAQLLVWLAINLAVIAALFMALPGRAGSGWSMLLSEPVRDRLLAIGSGIANDLGGLDEAKWSPILSRDSGRYGVSLSARVGPSFPDRGPPPFDHGEPNPPMAGDDFGDRPPAPPPEAPDLSPDQTPPPDEFPQSRFPFIPGGPADGRHQALANLITIKHSHAFGAYLVSIPSERKSESGGRQILEITASATDLRELLGFLGVTEWVLLPLLIIVISALLWWPFIWSITHTIGALTRATHRIAEGRFDVRVASHRRDELGSLAESVNRMAARLENFVDGQKRFVADVAHEITSPLARFQLGLGLLESRLPASEAATLESLHEEAQQMADMLNELLLFSRAGITSAQMPATTVILRDAVEVAIEREEGLGLIQVDIDPGLKVKAREPMLLRALANLVRNALRYAGTGTSIEIIGKVNGEVVSLLVSDRGPGVPEAALPQLGEPFFRPETARTRENGGVGLGLAIVRRCIAACDGEVSFHNREGGGFEAEIRLAKAD